MSDPHKQPLGISLTGGGARAAYQVGFLRFLARRFPDLHPPILHGVSAGAINASFLAAYEGSFAGAVAELETLWKGLSTDSIIRSDLPVLVSSFLRWAARLATGGSNLAPRARAIFDTAPLRSLLERTLPAENGALTGVRRNIEAGRLRAVGITTTCYATGRSVTWVQGRHVRPWRWPQRISINCELNIDHVMASSAVPLLFPAVSLQGTWHGDGGVRLAAPLSPAMYLGARRIIAISTRYQRSIAESEVPSVSGYPPPAQVVGVLLNAIFLDLLDYDSSNMARINRLIEGLPEERRDGMRPVHVLVLRPSEDLGALASRFEHKLPRRVRFFTRGLGAQETRSGDSLTMLMFDPEYLSHLIELGERDAESRASEIEAFIYGDRVRDSATNF